MQLAKSSAITILLLALPTLGTAQTANPQQTVKQAGKAVQGAQQAPQAQPTAPAPKPAAKAPAKASATKAPAKAQAAKPAAPKSKTAKAKPAEAKVKPAVARESHPARRDPFNPLLSAQHPGGPPSEHLPPGKAGLVVSTLRLDGIVRGPNGMIAVVSNPQQRVYFLRDGDQLYDGRVEHISMEGVSFHESGKDAFGKPVERQVVKRLYPSPGEPQ